MRDTGFEDFSNRDSIMTWVLSRFKNKTPKRSFIYLLYPHVGTDKDFDTMDKEGGLAVKNNDGPNNVID